MSLFKDLIEKYSRPQYVDLDLQNYESDFAQIDAKANRLNKDIKKECAKKMKKKPLSDRIQDELEIEENNKLGLLNLTNSKEYSLKMAELIGFSRTFVLYITSAKQINFRERKLIYNRTIEIRQLLIQATLKYFMFECNKEIDWNGFEFDYAEKLSDNHKKVLHILKQLFAINTLIGGVVGQDLKVDVAKICKNLQFEDLCKHKRIYLQNI